MQPVGDVIFAFMFFMKTIALFEYRVITNSDKPTNSSKTGRIQSDGTLIFCTICNLSLAGIYLPYLPFLSHSIQQDSCNAPKPYSGCVFGSNLDWDTGYSRKDITWCSSVAMGKFRNKPWIRPQSLSSQTSPVDYHQIIRRYSS
jgi:hypothetical protein